MARPKTPLISRRKTLEVALDIVDEEGLDALSIRRLATELKVNGASLYHHFANKDEILAGVAQLALADVRTPTDPDAEWREWLLRNVLGYRQALKMHPHLIPVLVKRHPLRIGLAEHNASAALLAVKGVPRGAILPVLEALEQLAIGSVLYDSAVELDEHPEAWKDEYPHLYQLGQQAALDQDQLFEVMARAIIDAVVDAVEPEPALT
ncbi:MAG TPA: TetR family transcriptional regulator [Acidimicrobiales bacterium]|nr:TetR family transcriptional regulator [Acidimicrobiales bacterium]